MVDPGLRRRGRLLIGLGLLDLVTGLVLAGVGVRQGLDVLVAGGLVLAVVGAGLATVLGLHGNRPEQL